MDSRIKKNQLVTVTIEDMGIGGEGIGKIDGYPLFIKDAVIGDTVSAVVTKAGKTYGFGHLREILVPSPDRVMPRCPQAKVCGGCQLQMLSYEKQLAFKERKVFQNLQRLGGFSEEVLFRAKEPILGMEEPWHYRNKEQFPAAEGANGGIVTGFYAARSHRLVPVDDCVLGIPGSREILDTILRYMNRCRIAPYDEKTGRGLLRHVMTRCGCHTGEWMVVLIGNAPNCKPFGPMEELIEELAVLPGMRSICYSPNMTRGNVIMGDTYQVLWGEDHISDRIGAVSFDISPLSFFQVNPYQTGRLYQTALDYADLAGNETVWDLYCGIGTISLFLAAHAGSVHGVEIVPQAVEDARKNAVRNRIVNAVFEAGKAEEVVPAYYERTGETPDVVVVDPPRKGCDEKLLETIVKSSPEKVVYVSCDSATLARDLKYLAAHGYELRRYRPCDMFPQTVHVETCALLTKASGSEA